jgi:hypothetical protein
MLLFLDEIIILVPGTFKKNLSNSLHARMHEALSVVESFLSLSIYSNFKNKSVINSHIQNIDNKKLLRYFNILSYNVSLSHNMNNKIL